MFRMRKFVRSALLAAAVLSAAAAKVDAQAQRTPGDLAIFNETLFVHEVFVIDAKGKQHSLGYVGHDELKYFDVPANVEALGAYRVAVQQVLPVPGVGVPATANPLKITPVLVLRPGQIASIVVGSSVQQSTVDVF